MKQSMFVVALATLACATGSPQTAEPSELQAQPRIFEAQIKEKIKAFIEQLGDPIEFKDVKLQTENENLKLDLSMTGKIDGISKYQIPNLKMSLIGFKFSFAFVIPELNIDISSYNLTASSNNLAVHGSSTFATSVKYLTFEGTGKLGSKGNGFMFLENIDVGVEIGYFQFNVTEADDEQSKKFNLLVQEVVRVALTIYSNETRQALSGAIMKFAEGKEIKFP